MREIARNRAAFFFTADKRQQFFLLVFHRTYNQFIPCLSRFFVLLYLVTKNISHQQVGHYAKRDILA
jgi:hypothetical protein